MHETPAPFPDLLLSETSTTRHRKHLLSPLLPQLSINQKTTCQWNLEDAVRGYHEAGVGAIGLWRPKLASYDDEEEAIELIQRSGLQVSSLSMAGGFTGHNGHRIDEAIEDAREAIRLAHRVGASTLTVVSGPRCGHILTHAKKNVIHALNCLADDAAQYEVTLALLPMHPIFSSEWTFINSLDRAIDILKKCNHPRLKLAFDVYHLWREPNLLERIPAIVDDVALVQLSDWGDPPRNENDRRHLGEGQIPISSIVRAFAENGYTGFYEIELWSEELWASEATMVVEECLRRFNNLCR